MVIQLRVAVAVILATACAPHTVPATPRRLGDAMHELGLRFERIGRAVLAERWGLARYDADEIAELTERDLTPAAWNHHPQVLQNANNFAATNVIPLAAAIRKRDQHATETAFAAAARACNSCHRAAELGAIEISEHLGAPVPIVDRPVP